LEKDIEIEMDRIFSPSIAAASRNSYGGNAFVARRTDDFETYFI
jgi:hypothetical protein